MKRRARRVGVVGAVGVARVLAVTWRAWDVSNEQLFKAHCAYRTGNGTFIVPFPIGHFHMIPCVHRDG